MIRFGFQNRKSILNDTKTLPGPGQYEMKSTFGSSKGFTLNPKIEPDFTKNEKKPGPEAYNPKLMKSSSTITYSLILRFAFLLISLKKVLETD